MVAVVENSIEMLDASSSILSTILHLPARRGIPVGEVYSLCGFSDWPCGVETILAAAHRTKTATGAIVGTPSLRLRVRYVLAIDTAGKGDMSGNVQLTVLMVSNHHYGRTDLRGWKPRAMLIPIGEGHTSVTHVLQDEALYSSYFSGRGHLVTSRSNPRATSGAFVFRGVFPNHLVSSAGYTGVAPITSITEHAVALQFTHNEDDSGFHGSSGSEELAGIVHCRSLYVR